jgi:hypothetical protein
MIYEEYYIFILHYYNVMWSNIYVRPYFSCVYESSITLLWKRIWLITAGTSAHEAERQVSISAVCY